MDTGSGPGFLDGGLIPSSQSHYFGRIRRCQDRVARDDGLAQEACPLLSSQREENLLRGMRRDMPWEK